MKGEESLTNFTIEFYKTCNGKCPVSEFLDSLDDKMRAKVLREICLLEEYGYELREPYSKSLNDGIFELRIRQSTNIARVLYFFVVDKKIVLTNGFIKKQMQTPLQEIALAKKYRDDYIQRKENIQ